MTNKQEFIISEIKKTIRGEAFSLFDSILNKVKMIEEMKYDNESEEFLNNFYKWIEEGGTVLFRDKIAGIFWNENMSSSEKLKFDNAWMEINNQKHHIDRELYMKKYMLEKSLKTDFSELFNYMLIFKYNFDFQDNIKVNIECFFSKDDIDSDIMLNNLILEIKKEKEILNYINFKNIEFYKISENLTFKEIFKDIIDNLLYYQNLYKIGEDNNTFKSDRLYEKFFKLDFEGLFKTALELKLEDLKDSIEKLVKDNLKDNTKKIKLKK